MRIGTKRWQRQGYPEVNFTLPNHRTLAAGRAAVEILKGGAAREKLHLARKEQHWLARIEEALDAFPDDEAELMRSLETQYGSLYDKASYDL
jgi:hypothetical protein